LAQRLQPFVLSSDFCDVAFVVEGRTLCAHRLVLAATSERFAASFRQPKAYAPSHGGGGSGHGGFAEAASRCRVVVPHHSHACFAMMLAYLYTGNTPQVLKCRRTRLCAADNAAAAGQGAHGGEPSEDGDESDEEDCNESEEGEDVGHPWAEGDEPAAAAAAGAAAGSSASAASSLQPLDRRLRLVCGSERYEQAVELLAMADEYMLEHLKGLAEKALVRNCLKPLLHSSRATTRARSHDHGEKRTEAGEEEEAGSSAASDDGEGGSEEGEGNAAGGEAEGWADPVRAVAAELLALSERANAWHLRAAAAHALRNRGSARRARPSTRRRQPSGKGVSALPTGAKAAT
jgi:hypothetical protein